jgi:hypothetical protein
MSEMAYKFTGGARRAPFTGFEWPVGRWVEAEGDVALCGNGIHACRPEALPRWLDEELWRIEVDGVEEEQDGLLVARRGRLLERIDGWDVEAERELARSCAARARELADDVENPLIRTMADDIATFAEVPDTPLVMYTTAHAFDEARPGAYYEERRRQADWLRERLGL